VIALRQRLPPLLLLLLRLTLGVALLWAGIAKIPEPGLFAQTVRAYEILPLSLVHPFSIVVPWIEATTGLFLVLGFWTRSSVLVALALLLCFGAALGVNLHRGTALSCGCFGLDGRGGSLHGALIRDVLLLSAAAVLAFVRNIPFSLDCFLHWRFVVIIIFLDSGAVM
jgi:uncharacterized membrane protein YphA (DoxX/SURF4 family)